ncbi:hypothetical protein AB1N83_012865 [Pleurotus pulmonarius]
MNLRSTKGSHNGAAFEKGVHPTPIRQGLNELLGSTSPSRRRQVVARGACGHAPSSFAQLSPVARPCIPSHHAVRVGEHLGISRVPGAGEHTAQNVLDDIHPATVADANLLLFFSSNPRDLDVDAINISRREDVPRAKIEVEPYNGARMIVMGKGKANAPVGEHPKPQVRRMASKRKAPSSALKQPAAVGARSPAKRVRFDSDTSAESQQDDSTLKICLPSNARLEEMLGRQPIWMSAPNRSSASPCRSDPDAADPSAQTVRRGSKTQPRSTRNR